MSAFTNGVVIADEWAGLKENPVYKRSMYPRGIRGLMASPIARAIGVGVAGFLLYFAIETYIPINIPNRLLLILVYAVMFWTIMRAIHHYYAWLEVVEFRRSGALQELSQTHLSSEDITLGLIYPAELAERITMSVIVAGFILNHLMAPQGQHLITAILVYVLFLSVKSIFAQPYLFLTDIEDYLRFNSPAALMSITFSKMVPTVIFFALLLVFIYISIFVFAATGAAAAGPVVPIAVAMIAAIIVSRFPVRWFYGWRLKRFYSRHASFQDLFDKTIGR